MKILLNGATSGTNFGDYLFAQIFQEQIAQKIGSENLFWYKSKYAMSDFFASRLGEPKKYRLKDIHALVYISGGYFCGNDYRFRDYVLRYLRYFSIGMKCILKSIPYAIIGLEVGKSKNVFIQFVQKKLLKKATIVVVRNEESFCCVKSYGINNVVCTSDTALTIEREWFENKSVSCDILNCTKKILLFHVFSSASKNKKLVEKVVPILNCFLENHNEYAVVLTCDQYSEEQTTVLEQISGLIHCDTIIKNYYDDPIALCKLIDCVDVIVTPKLHVGIVGARLNKSVISFCDHSEKIMRFYSQLNETGRSVPLEELSEGQGLQMLEKYHNVDICVSEDILDKAKSNFKYIDCFIKLVKEKEETQ